MKILHVVPTYFPAVRYGGPIYSVHGLAAAQAALGHDVSVFTTNADGHGVSDVPVATPVDLDGVEVTYFPVGTPRRLFRSPELKRALYSRAADFDVVHLHSVFLYPTLAAARAAHRARTPYVLSPRGMLVASLIHAKSAALKRGWLALFERRTIRQAAAIHFTAEREARDFIDMRLTARSTILLPNGVEEPVPVDAQDISADIAAAAADPGYVLYLGRLNWKKNLGALIEAIASLPDARLVIAGTDDEHHSAELRTAISSAGAVARATIIDRNVEGADKEWLFARCGIFALPSLNENFGNTVLEAMIRGKPVVVSSGAGVAQIVETAGCGLVAEPDAEALRHAISTLANAPATAREMGETGLATARAEFGWTAIAARMVESYRRLDRKS